MRRTTILIFAVLACQGASRLLGQQPPLPAVAAASQAVVKVTITGRDINNATKVNRGSGFLISPAGHLITAAHLFDVADGWRESDDQSGPDFTIEIKRGWQTWSQALVLYLDKQVDMALIRIPLEGLPPVPYISLGDSGIVGLGDSVVGFGYDTAVAQFSGVISQPFDLRYFGTFRVGFAARPGDSGGPVVDDVSGEAIGVIRAGLPGQPTTYVTPINLAANLVRLIRAPEPPVGASRGGGLLPLGSIIGFYGATTQMPDGYLLCNGAEIDRRDYPRLFEFLVAANPALQVGPDRVKLPDLRGEFLRGLDDGRGVDPGRSLGSGQAAAFEKHRHTLSQAVGTSGGWAGGWGGVDSQRAVNSPGDGAMVVNDAGGEETRPRNIALNFFIRAK